MLKIYNNDGVCKLILTDKKLIQSLHSTLSTSTYVTCIPSSIPGQIAFMKVKKASMLFITIEDRQFGAVILEKDDYIFSDDDDQKILDGRQIVEVILEKDNYIVPDNEDQ